MDNELLAFLTFIGVVFIILGLLLYGWRIPRHSGKNAPSWNNLDDLNDFAGMIFLVFGISCTIPFLVQLFTKF